MIRMISERQIPAYVQTMKLYESETGVETKGLWLRLYKDGGARRLPPHFPQPEPLFSKEETQAIIDEAEERAARMGGWTTKRHANYATTDVPVQELPRTHTWFREKALPEVLYPF